MFAAWVLLPLLLLALCAGVGLGVDALSGRRLPGALVLLAGFAACIVVAEATTLSDSTAKLTAPLLALLAGAGFAASLPWRRGAIDRRPAIVAFAVFLAYGAVVILSGEPSVAGFSSSGDGSIWAAIADRAMTHGGDLSGLAPSSYRATLQATIGNGAAIGAVLPLGAARELSGGDLASALAPYIAFLAALLSLALWQLSAARNFDLVLAGSKSRAWLRPSRLRALVVFIAACPALLYGISLRGGVEALAAAALVATAATLAAAALHPRPGRRRDFVLLALFAAALACVLAGPDLNSLARTLNPLQVLGVWPAGNYQTDPGATVATAVAIALAAAAALLGLGSAIKRRDAALLLYAAILPGAVAIALAGSPWAGQQALAIATPAALLLALLGAVTALEIDRPSGAVLLAVVAIGVLWSNVLAFRDADVSPAGAVGDLEQIAKRYGGQGPTLVTDYAPYATRHFLRGMDAFGASEPHPLPLHLEGKIHVGESVDTDKLDYKALLGYRTLILPRAEARSRPPLPYRLLWAGERYEVWQRPLLPTVSVLFHMPLGDSHNPAALPDCSQTVGLGLLGLANQLGAAPQSIVLVAASAVPPHAKEGDGIGRFLTVPLGSAQELCGRPWDWIEAIGPAG